MKRFANLVLFLPALCLIFVWIWSYHFYNIFYLETPMGSGAIGHTVGSTIMIYDPSKGDFDFSYDWAVAADIAEEYEEFPFPTLKNTLLGNFLLKPLSGEPAIKIVTIPFWLLTLIAILGPILFLRRKLASRRL